MTAQSDAAAAAALASEDNAIGYEPTARSHGVTTASPCVLRDGAEAAKEVDDDDGDDVEDEEEEEEEHEKEDEEQQEDEEEREDGDDDELPYTYMAPGSLSASCTSSNPPVLSTRNNNSTTAANNITFDVGDDPAAYVRYDHEPTREQLLAFVDDMRTEIGSVSRLARRLRVDDCNLRYFSKKPGASVTTMGGTAIRDA